MIDALTERILKDFKGTIERISAKYVSKDPTKLLRQFEANYDKLDIGQLIQMQTAATGMEEKLAEIMARKEIELGE